MKVAGVQMDVSLGCRDKNLAQIEAYIRQCHEKGAEVVVFPECATSGYCFESMEEAIPMAETMEGPTVNRIRLLSQELKTTIVLGMLERQENQIFNTAILAGPNNEFASYRKVHLPFLGVDRFVTPGDSYQVISSAGVKFGLSVCYDSSFPESFRCLALAGADLICLPTNWPPTSRFASSVIPNTRALENHVYVMAIDRVGHERGYDFIGQSKICAPDGTCLAHANHDQEEILFADIDPTLARQKHLVTRPGAHEVHRFNDRRPETYGRVALPTNDAEKR